MNVVSGVVALGLLLVVGGPAAWARPRDDAASGAALEQRMALPLPDGLRAAVLGRVRQQDRWAFWGGLAGVLLATATTFALGPDSGAWVFVGLALGTLIGGAGSLFLRVGRRPSSASRLARGRAVTLVDYVPAILLTLSLVTLAISAVAVAIGLTAGSDATRTARIGLFATVGALAVGATGVVLALARLVTTRAQPADSPLALAWDDALRGESLRRLVGMAGWLAAAPAVVAAVAVVPRAPGVVQTTVLVLAVTAGLLAVAGQAVSARGRGYAVRRLWPGAEFETAAA